MLRMLSFALCQNGHSLRIRHDELQHADKVVCHTCYIIVKDRHGQAGIYQPIEERQMSYNNLYSYYDYGYINTSSTSFTNILSNNSYTLTVPAGTTIVGTPYNSYSYSTNPIISSTINLYSTYPIYPAGIYSNLIID